MEVKGGGEWRGVGMGAGREVSGAIGIALPLVVVAVVHSGDELTPLARCCRPK